MYNVQFASLPGEGITVLTLGSLRVTPASENALRKAFT